MPDKIKKALQELQEVRNEIDKLTLWSDEKCLDFGVQYLDSDALQKALEKERLARCNYFTILYVEKGWPLEQIEIELKKLRLKS